MATATDAAAYEAKARTLLDSRMEAVRSLAQTQAAVTSAKDRLATVEKAHADAYAAAERSGWSADELRKVGLHAPARRRPGRPRRTTPEASTTTTDIRQTERS